MKIAMLTTVGERCGIAAYTAELTEALRRQPRMQVEVIPIDVGHQPLEHYQALARLLNAEDVDIVHIQHEHSFWGGILPGHSAYWTMRYLIKKPIVLTAHTTYSLAQMLRLKTERRPHIWLAKKILTLRRAYRDSVDIAPFATAYTIVHTKEAGRELVVRGAKPQNISVIPAGVPKTLPAPAEGSEFREKHGLLGKRVLTIFGYVVPSKGYEMTFDILPSLPSNTVLVVAGGARTPESEPYVSQLKERVAQAGLMDRVVFTGYLSDEEIAEAMAGTDVVLVPHLQATGSYSVMVPLSYGMPIVSSDLACFREIQERHACMELFRAGDKNDFLTRLLAILGSDTRQAELRTQSAEYAQKFSWDEIAKVTVQTYRDALKAWNVQPKNFVPLSMIKPCVKEGKAPLK
ncbi:hypothetical protein LBMAG21_05230 [Armatimonadota bacterium]|nr:hypothetical protein LBMAG21_05230 [Armatimonadota bacterium]